MKTRIFNLQNWSGEEIQVSYTKKGKFSFYGYDFQVAPSDAFKNAYEVFSPEFTTDPKEVVRVLEASNLESAIIQAVQWIANTH